MNAILLGSHTGSWLSCKCLSWLSQLLGSQLLRPVNRNITHGLDSIQFLLLEVRPVNPSLHVLHDNWPRSTVDEDTARDQSTKDIDDGKAGRITYTYLNPGNASSYRSFNTLNFSATSSASPPFAPSACRIASCSRRLDSLSTFFSPSLG
jgi:hypothetical protein